MNEIYWITRLDGIICVLGCISIFALIFSLVFLFAYIFLKNSEDECIRANSPKVFKGMIISITIFVATTLLGLFIPSEKDMYAIYGIGGTIDYIKDNDTAKQLPDKAIKALDAWADELIPGKNENN